MPFTDIDTTLIQKLVYTAGTNLFLDHKKEQGDEKNCC